MWIGHSCWINFCHFFGIVNLVIFHPEYIGMRMCMWIGHSCWINFCHFFGIVNLVIFHPEYISNAHPQLSTWAG